MAKVKNSNYTYQVNTVYLAWDGEVNPFGIGRPTIFLRFQGCPYRCYLKTLNVLCDTPEALEMKGGKTKTLKELMAIALQYRRNTGVNKVTLTGGDPLARDFNSLDALMTALRMYNFDVTVETAGGIDWTRFYHHEEVSFIVDYKLKSAGLKIKNHVESKVGEMRFNDVVKFVVYDNEDYYEMRDFVRKNLAVQVMYAAGVYFNGPMSTFDLFDRLRMDGLLGRVHINMQTHQLESYRVKHEKGVDVGKDI